MDIDLAVALVGGIAIVVASWITARVAGRNSARRVEHDERASDRARIKDLEDRDAEWARRCEVLWTAREADAIIKRRMGDHIDVLEDHIRAELPPPPPPRPDGI